MAYEETDVPVTKSQSQIRTLIMQRKGSKIAFITEPPREGFAAEIHLQGVPYTIRISANVKPPDPQRHKTITQQIAFRDREERRIWRVLYHHLKAISVAEESGVLDLREMLLPYIVTRSGKTIAEMILPKISEAIESNPARLLS
jgi:hypothetical protein